MAGQQVWVRDVRGMRLCGTSSDMSRRRSGAPPSLSVSETDAARAHGVLIDAAPSDTVGELKARVERRFDDVDFERAMLVHNGRALTVDGAVLGECGMRKLDTLYLRTSLRGLLAKQRDELAALGPLGARKEVPRPALGRPAPVSRPPPQHISDWSARRWADPRRRLRPNARQYALQTTPGSRPPPRPERPARDYCGSHAEQLRRLCDRVGNPIGLPGVDARQVMRDAFDALDADGNGSLDVAEFEDAYLSLECFGAPQDRDAAKLLACADVNGDGRMSFDEFCLFVSRKLQL